jgi:hypothetical protein
MKLKVQSLNQAGITAFSAWLAHPSEPAPREILTDPAYCDEIVDEFWVEPAKVFTTSYQLGEYLHDVFTNISDPVAHEGATGMWAWISLAFIDSLLSRSNGKPLDKAHYLEQPAQSGRRLAYRLIVRTAWKLVRLHGSLSEVALGSKKSPWGEMAEQMTSRQEVFAHRSFWEVAYRLYRTASGEPRRGATSQRPASARRDPTNISGKGGVRRLPTTFRQFDRTYLTRSMSLADMLEVLPSEYKRWTT